MVIKRVVNSTLFTIFYDINNTFPYLLAASSTKQDSNFICHVSIKPTEAISSSVSKITMTINFTVKDVKQVFDDLTN